MSSKVEVYCDMDCMHEDSGKCTKSMIRITYISCEDYEEITEEQIAKKYSDYFYAICQNKEKGKFWQKRRGIKLEWMGRELYKEPSDRYTDARTGMGLCCDLDKMIKDIPDIIEKILEAEKESELSPLFNDAHKYPIELSKALELESEVSE
jgi:thiaminase